MNEAPTLPVGDEVEGWEIRPEPEAIELAGRTVTLRPLSSAYFSDLYAATARPGEEERWTYLPAVMPTSLSAFWMLMAGRVEAVQATYAIFPHGTSGEVGKAAGVVSLASIDEANGSAEISWVLLGPELQRTTAATEAIYLLQAYVFDELGYRRLEWKCDSLNGPSKQAAQRFGFTFEGRFRQHRIIKGRNRDTDWFSIIDSEWPALRESTQAWLEPENFDVNGLQLRPLRQR